ncbi:MAG: hypothetical protein ACRYGG_01370, partial [Janthinobacterium lividum]
LAPRRVAYINRLSSLASTDALARELSTNVNYSDGKESTDSDKKIDSVANYSLVTPIARGDMRKPHPLKVIGASLKDFCDIAIALFVTANALFNCCRAVKRNWATLQVRAISIMSHHGRKAIRLLLLLLWMA